VTIAPDKDKRPLVVVPARGGSKRVPGKNIRDLGGRPLLAHTADAIAQAGLTDRTVLSTDDKKIAAIGEELGWLVPFRRPAKLAGDEAGTAETVIHAVDAVAADTGEPASVLVLQPTSPFRTAGHIAAARDLLAADKKADAVIGVHRLHVGSGHIFDEDASGALVRIDDSTAARPAFVPNGALYLIRTKALRRYGDFYKGRIRPLEMDALASLDIDTEEDFLFAEALLPLATAQKERAAL
jgi:CMP-N,N'-diacetyllegionaminic acid synthase